MLEKNMIFIWFGSQLPKFGRHVINEYQKCNPSFNTIVCIEPNIENPTNIDFTNMSKELMSDTTNFYWKLLNRTFARQNCRTRNGMLSNLADCMKFWLLNKYGGIYLDLDTFPVKPFDDKLLEKRFAVKQNNSFCDLFFLGCEKQQVFKDYVHFNKSGYEQFSKNIHQIYYPYLSEDNSKYANEDSIKLLETASYENGSKLLNIELENYYIDHYNFKTWQK